MAKKESYNISEIYFNLLKHFPFSITGYEDEEQEYATFFKKICESDEVISNDSIKFLISGFAKLQSKNSNFEDWQVEVLKRFLFHDQEKGFPEFILSVYLHALSTLSKDKRAVNIISDNVRSSVIIKIELSSEIESINFNYRKRDETLEILIPAKFYKRFNSKHISIDTILKKENHKHTPLLVKESKEFKSEYRIDDSELNSLVTKELYDKLCDEFMECPPTEFLKSIQNHKPNDKFIEKLKEDVFKYSDLKIEEIITLAYVTSIFCYFYDSSVTYFVSTARVKKNQRFTLGGIGVGLLGETSFSRDDLAFFSILANHIAANLSAQYVHDTNEELQIELKRSKQVELLQDFHLKCLRLNNSQDPTKIIDHGGTIANEHMEALRLFLEINNSKKISEYGLALFAARIGELFKVGASIDADLFVSCYHEINSNEIKNKCSFISNSSTTLNVRFTDNTRPYINISLAHFLIEEIKQRGDVRVTTCTKNNMAIIHADYPEFDMEGNHTKFLNNFCNSLQKVKSGKLSKFIKDHYDDFIIAGNLLIYEKDKYLNNQGESLNLKRDFKKVEDGSLTLVGKKPESSSKQITFVINYYSI